MSKSSEKINFSKRYADLQKLVAWFEREDIDLEEGLAKFEEGSKLVKELREYLQIMENRIKEFMQH